MFGTGSAAVFCELRPAHDGKGVESKMSTRFESIDIHRIMFYSKFQATSASTGRSRSRGIKQL